MDTVTLTLPPSELLQLGATTVNPGPPPVAHHPDPRPSLDTIGLKCGTDKATSFHGYLDFYERFFRDLREEPIKLLEIGVFHGQSVKMWSEYFPLGRIIGVDINPGARKYADKRILIEIADQSNIGHLVRLGTQYGPFDIIIEDGSHMWEHQIISLKYLYPFVKPGGFYVMEDIDTSFGDYEKQYKGNSTISAMEYLRKINDYVVADAKLNIAAEEDAFIRTFARATEFIAFHRRTAVLRVHPLSMVDTFTGTTRWASFPPLLAIERADALVPSGWLTTHLGFLGDATNGRALIGGVRGHPGQTIQGFAMGLNNEPSEEFQYKVLLPEGIWTDWVPGGLFVGYRGRNAGIRGFAVRLRGSLSQRFVCHYAGAFVDTPNLVHSSEGQECLTSNGAELEAMHVVLRPWTHK